MFFGVWNNKTKLMPLSWQAASAHKPCEQTPHIGDEKSQGTQNWDGRSSVKGWMGSLARALSCGLLHLQLELGRACSRAGAYNWPWMCIYKKNWLFLHSTFFVESRFDFRHCRGSGFWERGFICRTVASNRAHVYHVLAAAGGVPPSFLCKLSRGEVVSNRLRLLSIVPRIYYLPLHSFNINL